MMATMADSVIDDILAEASKSVRPIANQSQGIKPTTTPDVDPLAPAQSALSLSPKLTLPTKSNDGIIEIDAEEVSTSKGDVFNSYVSSITQGIEHPGCILEPSSLASVKLPSQTYPLFDSLSPELISSGKLSKLQLEGIQHTCQRHSTVLHDGKRAGFFLGDGAGVGKGRQVAGTMFDNYVRGRTKHVWISVTTDLRLDAIRDFRDIGCNVRVIDGMQELDKETRALGLSPEFQSGVLFTTYHALVSAGVKGKKSRLNQLIDWCGGQEFHGCLVFDECHKAKNYVQSTEGTAASTSSKTAVSVVNIQRLMPHARVVYCSATGVSELRNMAFMERLGLWGDGTAFQDFEAFHSMVSKNGLGAVEQLSMELKSAGTYVSRGLSFKEAEFSPLKITLSKAQSQMWHKAVVDWNNIRASLTAAIVSTNTKAGQTWRIFWSAHQRCFKALAISMKVETVVAEAKKMLQEGHAVVIGLQTTGEASEVAAKQRSKSDGENTTPTLFSTPAVVTESNSYKKVPGITSVVGEILRGFVDSHFPTTKAITDINGKVSGHTVVKSCAEYKTKMITHIDRRGYPGNALDTLIDCLGGPDNVAEMTGRSHRMIRRNGKFVVEARHSDSKLDNLNVSECKKFQSGDKLVAVISDAASTGISLHADRRAKNSRRRVHYTIELPWSADRSIQQLGRSHRSNAASGPIYRLVTTNLGGEARFAAAVAKRLESLGALTKGDRRAGGGDNFDDFNLFTPYGTSAVEMLVAAFEHTQMPVGMTMETVLTRVIKDDPETDYSRFKDCKVFLSECHASVESTGILMKGKTQVKTFLNRLLGVPVDHQNILFAMFCELVDENIARAKKAGRYSEGVTDVAGENITVIEGPTRINPHMEAVKIQVDRGVSFQSALQACQADEGSTFMKSKKKQYGSYMYLVMRPKPTTSHLGFLTRPNTGRGRSEYDLDALYEKYEEVSAEECKEGWEAAYEISLKQCGHGAKCKTGKKCSIGRRTRTIHLVCGKIVQYWTRIQETLQTLKDSENEPVDFKMKIVRVITTSGSRWVGLNVPEELVSVLRDMQPMDPPKPPTVTPPIPSEQLTQLRMMWYTNEYSRLTAMGIDPSSAAMRASDHTITCVKQFTQYAPAGTASEASQVEYKKALQIYKEQVDLFLRPLTTESATPVQTKLIKQVTRAKPTMLSFFKSSAIKVIKEKAATTRTVVQTSNANKQNNNHTKQHNNVNTQHNNANTVIVSPTSLLQSQKGNPAKRKASATEMFTPPPVKKPATSEALVIARCPLCNKILPTCGKLAQMHVNRCLDTSAK